MRAIGSPRGGDDLGFTRDHCLEVLRFRAACAALRLDEAIYLTAEELGDVHNDCSALFAWPSRYQQRYIGNSTMSAHSISDALDVG
mmetsp:Transcript_62487/g.191123  ORF Transcript_62487/g.191123 Transcript_62487/m.191123 type:complete len:86 (+) Transcript_62487:720-977(+)